MGRILPALGALLALIPAAGAAPPAVRADSISPRAARIYADSDPWAGVKRRVEALMGVYLVDPPRRHESERVHVTDGTRVRIDLWVPVSRLTDAELKTRAVEWLVFGRTQYASGVRGIFSEMAGIQDVVLVFHEVIRPDNTGRRRNRDKAEQIKRYLAIQLTRKQFLRFDPAPVEGCVARGDCSALFRSAFTSVRFDRRHTAARRQAEDGA
ncbi:MAG: hypothetical protein KC613_14425 [Myxococcales bacterium]|nr:hypothetical protein [Myxococcales bacterium]MCB9523136.1 hypothetical protein [Myxococcales bacterium]